MSPCGPLSIKQLLMFPYQIIWISCHAYLKGIYSPGSVIIKSSSVNDLLVI